MANSRMDKRRLIASIAQNIASNLTEIVERPKLMQLPECPLLDSDDEAFEFFQCNFLHSRSKKKKTQPFFDMVNDLSTEQFESFLHMSKNTYVKIYSKHLQELIRQIKEDEKIKPQVIYGLGLWKLTTNEDFKDMALKFQHTASKCESLVSMLWFMLSANRDKFLIWPKSLENEKTHFPNLPGAFGAVALKHFNVNLKQPQVEETFVLQIICTVNGKIMDCCIEPASDYSFDKTHVAVKLRAQVETSSNKAYLIGDTCFPLRKYLMRPFESRVEALSEQENLFNCTLANPLKICADVFSSLAARFSILSALKAKDLNELRFMIEAMCSLHNLCIDFEDTCEQNQPSKVCMNNLSTEVLALSNQPSDEDALKLRLDLMALITRNNFSL